MNDNEFFRQFNILSASIFPVLSNRMREVLAEAEKRLSERKTQPIKESKSKMTKEQILNKWLNKY